MSILQSNNARVTFRKIQTLEIKKRLPEEDIKDIQIFRTNITFTVGFGNSSERSRTVLENRRVTGIFLIPILGMSLFELV